MRLYLVHHADAVEADVDPQRPLSAEGLGQAARVAGYAKSKDVRPDAIWHSGKLRARQTAEAIYRVCNPFAEFRMVRGLRPDDSPQAIRDALRGEARDILLVSHMPLLPTLAVVLAPGVSHFPLHGMIALEQAEVGGDWVLRWTYSPS